MTFTVFACNTITGQNLGPVDCKINSWARVMNGSETAAFDLYADTLTGLNPATRDWYRQITTPAQMTFVIDWDGIPLWAGPVVNRQTTGPKVTINASGPLFILTRRKLADPANPTASYTYTGQLGGIATQIVQFALNRTGGHLPIIIPTIPGDTSNTYTYNGADLGTVSDLLSTLTGLENGPDIDFAPEWVDANRSGIQWRMRVGTTAAPRVTTPAEIAWDATAPRGGVADIQATDDISNMVTTDWAKGGTPPGVTTVDPITGDSTTTSPPALMSVTSSPTWTGQGWPLLDGETDYTNILDQVALDQHAAGDLTNYGQPTNQWTMTVNALADPRLGTYTVGDLPTVNIRNHFWIQDGLYTMRIVQIDGDDTPQVKVTMQGADAAGLDIIGSPGDGIGARIARLERLI